jgi:serine protease Do
MQIGPRPFIGALLLSPILALAWPASMHGQVAQAATGQNELAGFSRAIRDLTQRVSPAVVQVNVRGYGPVEADGRDVALIAPQRSTGSGVVVDPAGYIMTNAHVVRGAVSIQVIVGPAAGDRSSGTADPGSSVDASIIGIDAETDLALIKVDRAGMQALPFGDSDTLRQGDIVLAIGSPLGLRNSVSMGVVSAPARQMREGDSVAYIQTDASINRGNSGGALIDADGQLMGINTFILSQSGGSEGIGFAIPSNFVEDVYQQLRKRGHVHRGMIGATVQDITPTLATGLALASQSGVIVADVAPDGPARAAGLQEGDIVISLDGRPVGEARQFDLAFSRRQRGDLVPLGVLRGTRLVTLSVGVTEVQQDDDFLGSMVSPDKNLIARLGILCLEVDAGVNRLMPGLRRPDGLVVAAKSETGQGRYLDLQQGDVIHEVNVVPVTSLESFRRVIGEFKTGAAVVLLIERDGAFRYVSFQIE